MLHITQTQYDQIKDVLPVQRGNVEIENIVFLNAILSIAENGCKWRKCCLAGVPGGAFAGNSGDVTCQQWND